MAYAKSEETRKQLRKAMRRLMRSKGYRATTLKDILDESKVAKGSLYHQYPGGKLDLAVAAIEESNDRIIQALQMLAEMSDGPAEAVDAFCQYYIKEMAQARFDRGCPLAPVTLEAAAQVDELAT